MYLKRFPLLIITTLLLLILVSPVNAAMFKALIPGAAINVERSGNNAKVTWSIPEGEKERNVYVEVTTKCLNYSEGRTIERKTTKNVPWTLNGSTTVAIPQNYDSIRVSRVELVNNPPAPNVDQVLIEKDCDVDITTFAGFNVTYSDGQITATWDAEKILHMASRPDIPNMHLQIQRPGSGWEEATSNLSAGIYSMQVEPQEMSQVYRFRFVFRDNEVWGDKVWPVSVAGTQPPIEDEDYDGGGLITSGKGIPIFPADRQEVIMFWYKILAGLSGAFIFLILIRSGYQHMTNPSPASKASLVETIQMSIIGILIISFAPMFVTILININNGFVDLCLDTYNALTAGSPSEFIQEEQMGDTEWMDRFIAAPFRTLNDLITTLFGLTSLGEVIFNEAPTASILSNDRLFSGDINVGNELGTALISIAILGFTVYYNAVYTIRRWVVTAVLGATPIIIWIWVLSGRRQVIDIWLSELIQTIFMQSFHALTFGIFFSILCFTGNPGSVNSQFAQILIEVGKFLAAFGGVICFGMIVIQGLKIITTSEEKTRAEAVSNIKKALLGLIILGLAAMIASFLAQEPLTIYFPSVSGGETNITLWQLFFVLIAIILVSKMFSTIFMSFLARIGTVDEDMLATRGLGIMGGMVALGKAGAGAIKNTPVEAKFDRPNTTGGQMSGSSSPQASLISSNTNDFQSGTSSVSGNTPGDSPMVSGNTPGIGNAYNTPRTETPGIGNAYNTPRTETSGISDNTPGIGAPGPGDSYNAPESSRPGVEPYSEIAPVESVYDTPPGIGETSRDETIDEPAIDPQAQQVNYQQAILNTRGTVDGAANIGRHVGEAAGFAAPGAGKPLGVFFAAGTRVTAAPLASAHAIYKLGKTLPEGSRTLTNITGRETNLGAGVQTATTILLSPLGGKSVNIALKAGNAIDSFQNRHTPENT